MVEKAIEKKMDFGTVTVEQSVGAALRDLGYEETTFGPIVHEFYGMLLTFVLKFLPIDRKDSKKK